MSSAAGPIPSTTDMTSGASSLHYQTPTSESKSNAEHLMAHGHHSHSRTASIESSQLQRSIAEDTPNHNLITKHSCAHTDQPFGLPRSSWVQKPRTHPEVSLSESPPAPHQRASAIDSTSSPLTHAMAASVLLSSNNSHTASMNLPESTRASSVFAVPHPFINVPVRESSLVPGALTVIGIMDHHTEPISTTKTGSTIGSTNGSTTNTTTIPVICDLLATDESTVATSITTTDPRALCTSSSTPSATLAAPMQPLTAQPIPWMTGIPEMQEVQLDTASTKSTPKLAANPTHTVPTSLAPSVNAPFTTTTHTSSPALASLLLSAPVPVPVPGATPASTTATATSYSAASTVPIDRHHRMTVRSPSSTEHEVPITNSIRLQTLRDRARSPTVSELELSKSRDAIEPSRSISSSPVYLSDSITVLVPTERLAIQSDDRFMRASPTRRITSQELVPTRRSFHQREVLVGTPVKEGHVNYMLMYDMLTGIRISVSRCNAKPLRDIVPEDFTAAHKLAFDVTGNEMTPSSKYDFKFKDYAPWVFRRIRDSFHVDPAEYLLSLTGKYVLSELGSPGKSGSFFYYSQDYRFIIKTIHHSEHKFIIHTLQDYYEHIRSNPHTLLSRIFGLHRVKLPGNRKIHFVVMGNVFPPNKDIHEVYDLKGSEVGRSIPEEEARKNPRAVMKDLNWIERGRKLLLGTEKRRLLVEQMERDSIFLTAQKIMDYSLLVGLHDVIKGNRDNIRDLTLSVFEPNPETLSRRATASTRGSKAQVIKKAMVESDIMQLGPSTSRLPDNVPPDQESGAFFKSFKSDRNKISAVNPVLYGTRFLEFMRNAIKGYTGDPLTANQIPPTPPTASKAASTSRSPHKVSAVSSVSMARVRTSQPLPPTQLLHEPVTLTSNGHAKESTKPMRPSSAARRVGATPLAARLESAARPPSAASSSITHPIQQIHQQQWADKYTVEGQESMAAFKPVNPRSTPIHLPTTQTQAFSKEYVGVPGLQSNTSNGARPVTHDSIGYDDDFENYDEEFEDFEEPTHVPAPYVSPDIIDLQRAMKEENSRAEMIVPVPVFQPASFKQQGSIGPSSRDAMTDIKDDTNRSDRVSNIPQRQVIDICLSQQRSQKEKESASLSYRLSKRAKELSNMIDLDFAFFDVFELAPLNEYELYIRNFGHLNATQSSTQTNDDCIGREVQTEDWDVEDKWVQAPAEHIRDCDSGVSFLDISSKKDRGGYTRKEAQRNALKHLDSIQLSRFLRQSVQVVDVLLGENVGNVLDTSQYTSLESFGLSYSCAELSAPSFVQGQAITRICFTPGDCRSVLVAWEGPFLVFAGTADGGVQAWDLREPSSNHMKTKLSSTDDAVSIRAPSYSTDGVYVTERSHQNSIVAIIPLHKSEHDIPNHDTVGTKRTPRIFPTSNNRCIRILSALGKLHFPRHELISFVVLELKDASLDTDSDLGLRIGSRVKLIRSSHFQMTHPDREDWALLSASSICDPTLASPHIAIAQIEWSPHRPAVFFVLDNQGCIYVWDLLESDQQAQLVVSASEMGKGDRKPCSFTQSPTNAHGVSHASLDHLQTAASQRATMVVGFDDGSVHLHGVNSEFSDLAIDEAIGLQEYIDELLNSVLLKSI
ncbi:hypothetical protein BSLG_002646 [Batrachochytrium salamandrivorans]|nr:hypothetical protein BSLG_002646 [Batrachochytrium salamandrivorans]